jgi:hypothetical protein
MRWKRNLRWIYFLSWTGVSSYFHIIQLSFCTRLSCKKQYSDATFTDELQGEWPPRDPTDFEDDDLDHELTLPSSPWTYANGSLNPALEVSNGAMRRRANARRRGEAGAVPPYHPDFEDPTYDPAAGDSSESDDYDEEPMPPSRPGPRVRRGSEGVEVLPVDREEMLRRYVASATAREGRYQRYTPEPPSEGEDNDETDDVPLARLRSGVAT